MERLCGSEVARGHKASGPLLRLRCQAASVLPPADASDRPDPGMSLGSRSLHNRIGPRLAKAVLTRERLRRLFGVEGFGSVFVVRIAGGDKQDAVGCRVPDQNHKHQGGPLQTGRLNGWRGSTGKPSEAARKRKPVRPSFRDELLAQQPGSDDRVRERDVPRDGFPGGNGPTRPEAGGGPNQFGSDVVIPYILPIFLLLFNGVNGL
jgi:hypothetical protein